MKKLIGIWLLGLLAGGFSAGPVQAQDKTLINSLGMEFVLIPAGRFTDLCQSKSDPDGNDQDLRVVTISRPFYLGKYEVTQAQWHTVMGYNHSGFKGLANPVEMVSWDDIQAFIEKLNQKEGGHRYRLPTEAEWEYGARAGSDTAWFFGDDPADLVEYAWFEANSQGATHQVGKKKPNHWGLYDIYGNVAEWVEDWYEQCKAGEVTDPTGPESGTTRIRRGGSWASPAAECRSAERGGRNSPGTRGIDLGFRLAFSPEN